MSKDMLKVTANKKFENNLTGIEGLIHFRETILPRNVFQGVQFLLSPSQIYFYSLSYA